MQIICSKCDLPPNSWIAVLCYHRAISRISPIWHGNDVSPAANPYRSSPEPRHSSYHSAHNFRCRASSSLLALPCDPTTIVLYRLDLPVMPLTDGRISGSTMPHCHLCQRQYYKRYRALRISAASGKGFGKVQEKVSTKVC